MSGMIRGPLLPPPPLSSSPVLFIDSSSNIARYPNPNRLTFRSECICPVCPTGAAYILQDLCYPPIPPGPRPGIRPRFDGVPCLPASLLPPPPPTPFFSPPLDPDGPRTRHGFPKAFDRQVIPLWCLSIDPSSSSYIVLTIALVIAPFLLLLSVDTSLVSPTINQFSFSFFPGI